MCEEVKDPATQVPKAMVATVFINTFAGLLFLVPLVFVMPDLQGLAQLVSAQPVPPILKSAVGSAGGAFGLLVPLMVLALMCGIGCTTAASRCTWAFARDGAIPGSKWWVKVNKSLDVPLNAMMLSMVVQLVLGLLNFGSAAAFNAFSGVGVICLTASYACPIAISLLTGRKQIRNGKFYMGKLGTFCNIVAIGTFPSLPILINMFNGLTFFFSLVRPSYASLLYALSHSHHSCDGKLRPRRLHRCHRYLWRLVLGMGPQELCWSSRT